MLTTERYAESSACFEAHRYIWRVVAYMARRSGLELARDCAVPFRCVNGFPILQIMGCSASHNRRRVWMIPSRA